MAKISITLKDPDGVYESLRLAAENSAAAVEGIDDDERSELADSRRDSYAKALEKWIEYGEYVRVDFDTEAGTATVRPVR